MALTESWLKANTNKPRGKKLIKSDRDGLNARVSPKGKITFVFRYYYNGSRKELEAVKSEHSEARHEMIFRHNHERAELQKHIRQNKERQLEERRQLAKTIQQIRAEQRAEQKHDKLRQGFEDSTLDKGRDKPKQENDGQAINKTRKHRRRRDLD